MLSQPPGGKAAAVIELRRYRLKPGARETLIALFDAEFVETQEEAGMEVLGQFRDIDDPDCFVWLRGFAGMEARAGALARFYGGPVWAAHRDAANGTMVNSDDVLLLRPATPGAGRALSAGRRPPPGGDAGDAAPGFVLCTTCHLAPGTDGEFAAFFDGTVRPALAEAAAEPLAVLVTEPAENTFPRLPVRQGETVFVWMTVFAGMHDYAVHCGRLAHSRAWTQHILPRMEERVWRPNSVARLVPTTRSRLRG